MLNDPSVLGKVEEIATIDRTLSAPAKEAGLERVRFRAVWRSRYLIILPVDCHPFRRSVSAVMEGDRDRLLACLKCSPIQRIFLSRGVPMAEVQFWATLGRRVGRPVYLRSDHRQQSRSGGWRFRLERMLHGLLAAVLLLLLSPVMLGVSLFLLMTQGEVFERSWQVGDRGRLFVGLRFAGVGPFTALGGEGNAVISYAWLRPLPQLVNILRGETGFNRQFVGLNAFEQGETRLGS